LAGCQTRIAEYRPERSSSKLLFAAWSNSSPDFLLDLAKMARNIPARSMFERVAEAMKIKDFSSALANGSALSSVVEHYLHTVGVVGSKPTARTNFPEEIKEKAAIDTDSTQEKPESDTKMRFPKRVKHRGRVFATIYDKSKAYPMYRVAWIADGKRKMQAFEHFGGEHGANQFAEAKARELSKGLASAALTGTQSSDALAAFKVLERFNQSTGKKFSLHEILSEFVDAAAKLNSHSIREAVDGFLRNTASVKRKGIAEALLEFSAADEPRTKSKDGGRAQLSSEYFRIRGILLGRLSSTFPGHSVCDLTKAHLDTFFTTKPLSEFSPKYRNHHRVSIRQFFAWCVRKDYLSATHRLNEADGMRQELANTAEVEFYTPNEFRSLLECAEGPMSALIAVGGLTGLRTAELLRLDWADVWRVAGHIEVTSRKSKTRQRRLVETCAALDGWLAPYRSTEKGAIWAETESVFQKQFSALCETANLKRKENALRHAFCTFHFALHANENLTAMMAGNTPAMIHGHYKGLATKAEAERWFETKPVGVKNVIPMRAAR
jgi:integrase